MLHITYTESSQTSAKYKGDQLVIDCQLFNIYPALPLLPVEGKVSRIVTLLLREH